ncbi:hypothetical protein [Streptomyces sp. NBC_00286]|uniref:hypothetical protein n=1 Tax=Streptomyces sp. NBC_00286 TaxID=2975701 RepID=UPI002E2A4D9A|nr:hypothetical protein [Streptomyces sp. NBC_00286]
MTHATTPTLARERAKMTIRVYTVGIDGVASEPRTTVAVPYGLGQLPPLGDNGHEFPACACPLHRKAGADR